MRFCQLAEIVMTGRSLAELSQALRVAEQYLLCKEPDPRALAMIRKTLARDAKPLTFGGKR
jgi:hypothetical protein